MNEKYEKLLLLKHPLLRPNQNPEVVSNNMKIMAKQLDNKTIESFAKLEKEITGKTDISNKMALEKSEPNPEIYGKKEEYIWDLKVFGIQCEAGWFNLIDVLFDLIEEELKGTKNTTFSVEEIKEKYATLEIYTYGATDKIDKYIDNAEKLSAHICEYCGRPGKITGEGWYITLCDKCLVKKATKLAPYKEQVSREDIKKKLIA